MIACDVREAEYVRFADRTERIVMRWGIRPDGRLASPAQGGFGVITESGEHVNMWQALMYLREA